MELEPHNQDIIKLLTKLKDVHVEYPDNILVGRRQIYLKRMAEIELGMNGGSKAATANPKHPGTSPTVGTLLEAALIVAIVAESGVMAYFYRDKLADFVQTIATEPGVEEATPASVVPISSEVMGISPSPAVPSTLPSAAVATAEVPATSTSTPGPAMAGENSGSATPGVNSTPKGNNGNHYGQTPKPQRTKENSGKDDKPPKNDDKPIKDKPPKKK